MRIPTEKTVTMKATKEDLTLLDKLGQKLRKTTSDVIRDGLRALAKVHKVSTES